MEFRIATWNRFVPALIVTALCAAPLSAQPSVDGQWTGVIDWPIEAIHAAMLPTGKLMVWQTWTESVLLWDPDTGGFSSPVGFASVNPFCAGHAWLPDGRLLVVGGHQENYNGEEEANIYDPFTNTWDTYEQFPGTWVSNVPDMNATNGVSDAAAGRWYPSATTLGSGDVLTLAGDMVTQGVTNPLPQVYEQETNTWRDLTTAVKTNLPEYPRTFLIPDGRIAVMSDNNDDTYVLDTSGTGAWEYVDDTLDSNLHNYGPAVMYDAGKIAYIGGGHNPTANVSMIDFNDESPAWCYAGGGTTPPSPGSPYRMAEARRQNDATILADGTVLITGGSSITDWNDPDGLVSVAEIWNPVTEQVTQVAEGSDSIYRGYHSTATLLPDGRVLIAGGNHDEGGYTENKNAEVYSPPYLFNGSRPTITSAPGSVEYGETFFVATPDAFDIADVTFIVPGITTHSFNWTQRASHLDFTEVAGGVDITLPANSNENPPGYYMLFLINDSGVPSVAEWVQATFAAPGLAGDYNGDDTIDAADYTAWRDALTAGASELLNDPTPGTVDESDFLYWRDHFGEVLGSGAGAGEAAAATVPEPTGVLLLVIGALLSTVYRGRLR